MNAPSAAMPARHLDGAEFVRVVALIGVVVIHTSQWPLKIGDARVVYESTTLLARFSVPAFIVLSGLLLEFNRSRDKPTYLRNRLRRSLVPFAFWGPVFTLTGLLLTQDIHLTYNSLAGYLIGGVGHLYFLPLIAEFYVVYLIWPKSGRGVAAACALAILLQVGLSVWRLTAPNHGALMSLMLVHGYELFPFWIGYFGLGVACGHLMRSRQVFQPRWLLPSLILTLVCAVAVLQENNHFYPNAHFANGTNAFLRPWMFPFAAATTATLLIIGNLVSKSPLWFRRLIATLSVTSLGIYIIHPLVLYVPGRILQLLLMTRPLPWSLLGLGIFVPVTMVLSYYAVRILMRTRLRVTLG